MTHGKFTESFATVSISKARSKAVFHCRYAEGVVAVPFSKFISSMNSTTTVH